MLSLRWVRYVLLALTVTLLLVPGTIISSIMALLLIIPIAVSGVRQEDASLKYWATYVIAFTVYVRLRGVADDIGPGPYITYPILLDRILAGGSIPTLLMQNWYTPGAPRWWDYSGVAIYLTHYFAVPAAALLAWRFLPRIIPRLLLGVSLALVVGTLVHLLIPTAPPWIAGQSGVLPTVYRPLLDILSGLTPGAYEFGSQVTGRNDVAAMPSMHVAAATFVALVALNGSRLVAAFGVTYAVLMSATLVYFGEHYVVDAIAGSALALGTWWVCRRFVPTSGPLIRRTAPVSP
jgi:membrane-associated phospholipid phosphatase